MVGFDDFDVVAMVEDFCSQLEDFKRGVDADAHIGREHNACLLGGFVNQGFTRLVKSCGAND